MIRAKTLTIYLNKNRRKIHMKDNKKKVIIIALLILVILVGIKILIGNNKNRKNVNNANTSNVAIDEKNVKTLSDGTRLNNSTKMQEIKRRYH